MSPKYKAPYEPERMGALYEAGVSAYAASAARPKEFYGRDEPPNLDAAHARGMAMAASGQRPYGPPAITQEGLANMVSSTHADEKARWTPERIQRNSSYMSAAATDRYGDHNRDMAAHQQRYPKQGDAS